MSKLTFPSRNYLSIRIHRHRHRFPEEIQNIHHQNIARLPANHAISSSFHRTLLRYMSMMMWNNSLHRLWFFAMKLHALLDDTGRLVAPLRIAPIRTGMLMFELEKNGMNNMYTISMMMDTLRQFYHKYDEIIRLSAYAFTGWFLSWVLFFIMLPFMVRSYGKIRGASFNYGFSWFSMIAIILGLEFSLG